MKNNIAQKLKELRFLLKLTQVEFASKSGLSQSFYSSVEKGSKSLSKKALKRVIKAFGVVPDYFEGITSPIFQESDFNSGDMTRGETAKQLNEFYIGVSLLIVELQENGGSVPFKARDGLYVLGRVIEELSSGRAVKPLLNGHSNTVKNHLNEQI